MKICALLFAALALRGQSGPNFYSLQQEAQLGAKLAEAQAKQSTATAHENVREYVERLGRLIAAELPAWPLDYRFAVIAEETRDGSHEPLSLPGGYIFVSQKLILAAHDEAEFAGMLAHAMAHSAARHSLRVLARDQTSQGINQSVPQRSFASAFEYEADALATQAAWKAGFDPAALARYLDRTQLDKKRLARIEKEIDGLPARSYSSSTEFAAIQQELR
jgi:beta-barrel assembly-enhancing protease